MECVREEATAPSFGFGLTTPTDSEGASTEANVGSPTPRPKRKYARKNKAPGSQALEDDETRRKRDILASVACLENIEDYVGEKIKPIEFRNMIKERP